MKTRTLVAVSILVFVLACVDALTHGGVRSVSSRAAGSIFSSAHSAYKSVSGSGFFTSRATLARENAELNAKLALLESVDAEKKMLEAQNEALVGMVHLAKTRPGVTASVISSFSASPYGTFKVAVGDNAGITRGSVVYTASGFAIGRVSDVYGRIATVLTLFAPGEKTEVMVGKATAEAYGLGGGNARIVVSRDATVAVDDAVRAPGLNAYIGVVGSIETDPASATKTIYFRSPVNFATLQFVYITP